MTSPPVLAQLSDPHVGADWGGPKPAPRLVAAVDAVKRLAPRPDAVLVSGDLTDHATDAEYEKARELLARLPMPVHVLPGNHDRREPLRRYFALPGVDGAPIQYTADVGELRLVILDTTHPGEDFGELDDERLGWLEQTLADAPDRATILAMHHPPLKTGIAEFDAFALRDADREKLREIVARHPQVRKLVGGHVHRALVAELGGRPVLSAPSTYVQAALDFTLQHDLRFTDEPGGYALHALVGGEVLSSIEAVT